LGLVVRGLYALAAPAVIVMAWVVGTGRIFAGFITPVGRGPQPMDVFATGIFASSAFFLLGVAGILAYRAARPLWWAKLLGGLALPWIMFSAVYALQAMLMDGNWDPLVAWAPAVGAALVILASISDLILSLVRREPVLKPTPRR
jgi:hypothetical protein